MKIITLIGCSLVGMIITSAVVAENYSYPVSLVDEYFDSYGNLSWEDEQAHLDGFAFELQSNEHLVGYIIVYAGRQSCVDEAKERALRAKEYLVKTRGIQANRIKWIDGGYREKLTVILQPLPHNAPGLVPSPTIKPSEADIKRCKPKFTKRKMRGS